MAALSAGAVSVQGGPARSVAAAGPCDAPIANPIVCENSKPGNPAGEWEVTGFGAGDPSIQGYATDISVNKGETVRFKVKTPATSYRLDIYRLGHYGGLGARRWATIRPAAALPQAQPACLADAATGLVDCGNWAESASWAVPADAVSGVYVAKLVRDDGTPGDSHVVFVVRDDAGRSDLLFQTSDTTWHAYNTYGGNSLYVGAPAGRAYKVSYNRPFNTRSVDGGGTASFLFNAEVLMIRWLEANGYSVSYTTGVDSDRRGAELLEHKAFLSVGHDEYWSARQRQNVEAARDAGVHLAFFSGNEVFWKTRWENSIDGSGTPYRTLVSYKETHANAKIDPDPAWTGTWADPRFSPPADGGKPQNALTGTLFMVNGPADYRALKVPAADGRMRFWRNTAVAAQEDGQAATLGAGCNCVIGYEWDEDPDNGHRPPGLVRLSSTTAEVPAYLQDYGSRYAPGTATHRLTLYRHASGALVFGAGTVGWAHGLMPTDFPRPTTPEPAMRQATVNLLADMGALPATLQAGLVSATASTDRSAPSSTITAPSTGASVAQGTPVAISGTATDGGGAVGGVEVSTDGGATWHPADGRASWSYSWTPTASGSVTIKTRAVDDSGNIETPGAGLAVTVAPRTCPCSLFPTSATPAVASDAYQSAVELGVRFRADVDGYITGIRFYKGPGNTGTHVGSLWAADGTKLATATFANETATGWQQVSFAAPVAVAANTTYVASYHAPNGGFAKNEAAFATQGVDNAPLRAPRNTTAEPNGVYRLGPSGLPDQTYNATNYWVDVVFATTVAPDTTPPVIGAVQATGVTASGATIAWTTSEAADSQIEYGTTTAYGASTTLDTNRVTAHSVQLGGLEPGTLYHYRVKSRDAAGNLATSGDLTFTTAAPPTCPCTIWPATATPAVPSQADTGQVELGVKFRSDVAGYVTGIRFYKGAANTGTHVGRLWTATGTPLGTVTFSGETASGWQQATLTTPVAIQANTTYVVSYHAPNGGYSVSADYFAASGTDNGPLHALRDGVAGGNGVYAYGPSGTFPTGTYAATNYWVDVVFATAIAPDTTPPRIGAVQATGVTATGATIGWTTDEAADSQVEYGTTAAYGSSTTLDTNRVTAHSVQLAGLQAGTLYHVRVRSKDAAGNLATSADATFTTAAPPTCPCSIWPATATPAVASQADSAAVELGVKFRADANGYITGLRFYKGAGNTGTHVGHLWTATGTLLGSVTFSGETASGWQQATFATPIQVTANTTYVASYHSPNGGYAVSVDYFAAGGTDNGPLHALANGAAGGNGVYAYGPSGTFPSSTYASTNYWVDVVFSTTPPPADTTPPAITAVQATGVTATGATVAWTTDEAADSQVEYGTTTAYGASTTLDAARVTNHSVQLGGLTPGTLYHVRVRSKDAAGNLATSADATFTTAAPPTCPCSIWPSSAAPAVASQADTGQVELGVKFRSDVAGYVTGIRFYKGPGNTGTHVGSLWAADGTKLATATFANETATGWQQVSFAAPVAVAANTTYVASYHAPNGGYAINNGFFLTTGADNAPLHALANGVEGPNGVYKYGPSGSFPTETFNGTNYWVDVIFTSFW